MKRLAALVLSLFACTTIAAEQADPVPAAAPRNEARPLQRKPALYPQREFADGREGWVVVSYVVRTDGTVRDVVIEDSSGVPAFERAAVTAVRQWTYAPATVSGVAVEQAVSTAKLNFRQSPPSDSARYPFVRAYRAIMKQIEAGDLDGAHAEIAKLEAQPTWNLYEDAWYWMLKFSYHHARGEVDPQVICLRRALAYEGTYLPADTYLQALRNLFLLEVSRAEYASALRTFARLQRQPGSAEMAKELAGARDQVNTLVFGPDTLARPGRIESQDAAWWHVLARREFGFDEVSGSIAQLEVRCANQVRKFEWTAGKAWKIPAAWGECTVVVQAPAGTEFRLLEYPASPGGGGQT